MAEEKMIKLLLLSTDEMIISEISEIPAEFGDPNCRLVNPYKLCGDKLEPWLSEYSDDKEMMIQSDKILTLVDPNKKLFAMYLESIQ